MDCIRYTSEADEKCKCKINTRRTKYYPYEQYYIGERDAREKRSGDGHNHWSSAQSMEFYTGHWIRDVMNGKGEYRWRYLGPKGLYFTYEGDFFANNMHGYGTMSFPDGRIFSGLFQKDVRFGPGVETHLSMHEDVGLWRGRQLVRLTWRPLGVSITPDLNRTALGKSFLNFHRVILTNMIKTVQESTSLIMESLTEEGEDLLLALNLWPKLEDKPFFLPIDPHRNDTFEYDYFDGKLNILKTANSLLDLETQDSKENHEISTDDADNTKMYYVWNNTDLIIHIMKRCYLHEQRRHTDLNVQLEKILNGPRKAFKPAGLHERHCRSLLMASYLGYVAVVAQLLNECNIYPDVSDMLGNTALMYATYFDLSCWRTVRRRNGLRRIVVQSRALDIGLCIVPITIAVECGDKTEVIHFLTEAGANVNSYNDCCLTPLGVAIMRHVCVLLDINTTNILQAFLPPPDVMPQLPDINVDDWLILRDLPQEEFSTIRANTVKSITKTESRTDYTDHVEVLKALRESIASPNKSRDIYPMIEAEYFYRVSDNYPLAPLNVAQQYIFNVNDLLKEIETQTNTYEAKFEKRSSKSKISKQKHTEKQEQLSVQPVPKIDASNSPKLEATMKTIVQLLKDGGDPRLVRCPQPALLMAVVAQSAELVQLLVNHGVDVNETYPAARNYYALDVTLSFPLSLDNFAIINTLLRSGADVHHRIDSGDKPGPTLLHVLLAKPTVTQREKEILGHTLQVLVEHNCDPKALYNGRSAMDLIIQCGDMNLLNIIVKTQNVGLNQIINAQNETALVKLFTPAIAKNIQVNEWLRTIANLLHYGADPFLICHDDDKTYSNVIHFAKNSLEVLEETLDKRKPVEESSPRKNMKVRASVLTEKSVKSLTAMKEVSEITNFKKGIDLLLDFSRDWLLRWLTVKLVKEIIVHITNYKHLAWDAILKEYKNQKVTGLWLTPQRCLEIWQIMTVSKWKVFKDNRRLKHLLCIVYVCNKTKGAMENRFVTTEERNHVMSHVSRLISEHNIAANVSSKPRRERYVIPEFYVGNGHKYNVCFECLLWPENDGSFYCPQCHLIRFCSNACLNENILRRPNDHPCNAYLKETLSLMR